MESFRRRVDQIARAVTTTPTSGIPVDNSQVEAAAAATEVTVGSSSPGISKRYWMPDAITNTCYECEVKFTTFRRRHHCRICGQIFCSKCCNNYISGTHIGQDSGQVRVCCYCYKLNRNRSQRGLHGSVSQGNLPSQAAGFSGSQGQLTRPKKMSVFENPLEAVEAHEVDGQDFEKSGDVAVGSLPGTSTLKRKTSSISASSPFLARGSSNVSLPEKSGAEGVAESPPKKTIVSLKNPQKLTLLIMHMGRPLHGIPQEVHRIGPRTFPASFLGKHMIQWLMKRDASTPKETAVTISQALIDFGYLRDLTVPKTQQKEAIFDEETPYRLSGYQQYLEGAEPVGELSSLRVWSNSSPTRLEGFVTPHNLSDNLPAGQKFEEEETGLMDGPDWFKSLISEEPEVDRITPKIYDTKETEASDEEDGGEPEETVDGEHLAGLRKAQLELSTSDELGISTLTCPELDGLYAQHQDSYCSELMRKERLSEPKWKNVIKNFSTKIVSHLKFDYKTTKNMDARKMVKVKRLPGGSIDDSEVVKGEVFTGRVARVGMPLFLVKPRMLLIKDPICFPRSEKLVSMENLQPQMEEYVKNVVDKLLSFRPHVIMAENVVIQGVVDALSENGISLILKVKPQVLERLQGLFDVRIITSLDSTMEAPNPGDCGKFSNKTVILDQNKLSSRKSLIILEKGSLEDGCTVLLRGGTSKELGKVKRILLRIILLKANARFEKAFLLTEYAQTSNFDAPDFKRYNHIELTLSPFICIDKPNDLKLDEDEGLTSDEEPEEQVEKESTPPKLPALITTKLTSGLEERFVRNLLADYRRRSDSRTNPSRKRQIKHQDVIPKDKTVPLHCKTLEKKALPLLYSSHSPISRLSPQYCVKPWVASMCFYGVLDMPIGLFLEEFCFGDEERCPNKSCDTALRDHVRRFCLSNFCVTLNVQEVEDNIMTASNSSMTQAWRFCTICQMVTPILFLNEDAWMYSFAMFFLLLFYEDKIVRRGSTAKLCSHSLHKDHHICFSRGDTLASFKVSGIQTHDLAMPSEKLAMPSNVPSAEKMLVELKVLSVHGTTLYSQIHEKLTKIKPDKSVAQLLIDQEKEFESYKRSLEKINENVTKGDHLMEMRTSILMLKVSILQSVARWKMSLSQLSEDKRRSGSGLETPRAPSAEPSAIEGKKSRGERLNSKENGYSDLHLNSPFSVKLHPDLYLPPGIIVDEDQPSSIIAYTLATNKYQEFLKSSPAAAERDNSSKEPSATPRRPTDKTDQEEKRKKGKKYHPNHFQHSFSDDTCEFYCSVLFGREFENFRQGVIGKQEDYVSSLASCNRFRASGGKSGVNFFKTCDERFIIKELNRQEAKDLNVFAPKYMDYLIGAHREKQATLLAKIFGVYEVGYKNAATGHSFGMVLMVMENLTYKRNISASYDLKGSLRNRMVNEHDRGLSLGPSNQVLMDENLVKSSREKPFYVTEESYNKLIAAIGNDTSFLEQNSMMDYSLFVAIDSDTNELVLGIIDYVRVYTWDKQLESLIKSTGLLGGAGKTPTVVAPDFYKRRFEKSMTKYFTLVPEYWYDLLEESNE